MYISQAFLDQIKAKSVNGDSVADEWLEIFQKVKLFVYGETIRDLSEMENFVDGIVIGVEPTKFESFDVNYAIGDDVLTYELYNQHNDLSYYAISLGQQLDMHEKHILPGYYEDYKVPEDLVVRFLVDEVDALDMLAKQYNKILKFDINEPNNHL
ncbi:hypothetical protein MA9V2_096 [Chryseobacterium phage MA9V-2]|nr:hypothetical protein MA9V2_096 [Chryseobacterium phage MA9V-2]